MLTETEVANRALARLDLSPISSLEDDSPLAKKVRPVWGIVFASVLTAHDWSFARKYDRPARLATEFPEHFPYPYAFALPEDCLKVRNVIGQPTTIYSIGRLRHIEQAKYEVSRYGDARKQAIFADNENVVVCYTSGKTLLDDFSPDALDVLILKLAIDVALNVKNATQRVSELVQRYQVSLDAAIRNDLKSSSNPSIHGHEYSLARRF